MMNDSLRTLESVLKHLDEKGSSLLIPSYQRGYRWTPSEVRRLLDDIDGEQPGGHYFLQLLAVREDGKNTFLRIIDGQQRLTTVLLIMDCLHEGVHYRGLLHYETRKDSSLDRHFMKEASNTIIDWFSNKSDEQKRSFWEKLMECEFLYFPIKDADMEFDFFSRLNTWKIEARDSELVKCFLLSNDDPAEIGKRAIRWNLMERKLSDNGFWGMFSNNRNANLDRMGVLLSHAIDAKWFHNASVMERFPLFAACKTAEKAGVSRSELWSEVEQVFALLSKWYEDRACRHLVGWFFHCSEKTVSEAGAVVAVDEDTIANAIKAAYYLRGDGKWLEDENLYETMCGDSKKWLIDYLLLANAAWCSDRCGVDYDFYRHSLAGGWSIEHVHARNQRMLGEVEFKSLKFKSDDIAALWDEYRKKGTKDEANAFLQENLSEESGYPDEDEDNSFGNLALLPRDANSSLNDKLFLGKQREILSWALQRDDACYWAPPLTVAMFAKEVGCKDDKFREYWSKNDRESYSAMVRVMVEEFLKQFAVQ